MREKYLWCAFALLISTMIAVNIYEARKAEQLPYIIVRANCNDTLTIKADTFRVYPRENKAYFVEGERTIAVVDSVNQIKRK